jgi:hypothetical protein
MGDVGPTRQRERLAEYPEGGGYIDFLAVGGSIAFLPNAVENRDHKGGDYRLERGEDKEVVEVGLDRLGDSERAYSASVSVSPNVRSLTTAAMGSGRAYDSASPARSARTAKAGVFRRNSKLVDGIVGGFSAVWPTGGGSIATAVPGHSLVLSGDSHSTPIVRVGRPAFGSVSIPSKFARLAFVALCLIQRPPKEMAADFIQVSLRD